jgi:hypothetical protein
MLEKWLKKMSNKGWHLVSRKFAIIYYFEKGLPEDKEYFVWSPTYTGEGRYSIDMRYPSLAKTYGKNKKKSKLNNNSFKNSVNIIEVDPQKKDYAFDELRHDRNRIYILQYIVNSGILFFVFSLTVILINSLK